MPQAPNAGRVQQGNDRTDAIRGDEGMVVLSYVLSGMLFYGGLGWLGAHYLHQGWMLPVGMVLGLIAAVYLVIKRYGKSDVTTIPQGVEK